MTTITQSLATKAVVGMVAVVMTMSAATASAATSVSDLCALAKSLGITSPEFTALCADKNTSGNSSTAGAGQYVHHPSIDFEFTRNLYIGARGNDVMMLQKVLNLNADTKVAMTGAGSPGNETAYFGPATRAAVAKFQAKWNISPTLGYFYPLTRAEMNKKAAGNTTSEPATDTPSNTTDDLKVSAGNHPDDELMPSGVVRFPVTAFKLEAGNKDVDVREVTVRYNGRARHRQIIDSVVILDKDMNIVGEAESLDSDGEAEIKLTKEIKDGKSLELFVGVNAKLASTDFDRNDGLYFTMDVVAVEASADVDGLPISSGATMTVQDNVALGDVAITLDHRHATLKVGSEKEELVEVRIDANPDDTNESVFVKSLRLENKGNGDLEDLEDFYIEVDYKKFNGSIDGDYIVFDFGNGYELKRGRSEDFTVYADVRSGAGDEFRFIVEDKSDIYAVSEEGYGMPAVEAGAGFSDGADKVTISTGTAKLNDSSSEKSEDITTGRDVVIGMFDFNIRGEGIQADDLTVNILLENGTLAANGRVRDLLLEDVKITDKNGKVIVNAEDARWVGTTPTTTPVASQQMRVEFDRVKFPEGNHEDLKIVATLSNQIGHESKYTVQNINFVSFNSDVEGQTSDESLAGQFTGTASFRTKTVAGAVLALSVDSSPSASNVAKNTNDYHFATFKFDARNSGEDIKVQSFEAQLTFNDATSTDPYGIEAIDNCRLFDSKDKPVSLVRAVEGRNGISVYRFEFDNPFVVTKDEIVKLNLKCDIGSSGIHKTDSFAWGIASNAADREVRAEGANTGNKDFATATAATGPVMTIDEATVSVVKDSNTPDAQVVKLGTDAVVLGILEVKAEDGKATIEEVEVALSDVSVIETGRLALYYQVQGQSEQNSGRHVNLTADNGTSTIDGLSIDVQDGQRVDLIFKGDVSAAVAESGSSTALTVSNIMLKDASATTTVSVGAFETVTGFEAVPTITLVSADSANLQTQINKNVFEFSIKAEGGDVVVDRVFLDTVLTNTDMANIEMFVYEDTAHNNQYGSNNQATTTNQLASTGSYSNVEFLFPTAVTIAENETFYFVLEADVTATDATRSVLVTLKDENPAAGISFTTPSTLGNSDALLDKDLKVLHKKD